MKRLGMQLLLLVLFFHSSVEISCIPPATRRAGGLKGAVWGSRFRTGCLGLFSIVTAMKYGVEWQSIIASSGAFASWAAGRNDLTALRRHQKEQAGR